MTVIGAAWQPYNQEGLREEVELARQQIVRDMKGGCARLHKCQASGIYEGGMCPPSGGFPFFPCFFTQPLVKLEYECFKPQRI